MQFVDHNVMFYKVMSAESGTLIASSLKRNAFYVSGWDTLTKSVVELFERDLEGSFKRTGLFYNLAQLSLSSEHYYPLKVTVNKREYKRRYI
ncbi:hypothetical protein ACFFLZ_22190 [Photobacterium aphoticum]|nr:hypothetical protein [Photobacterium aphoticum]